MKRFARFLGVLATIPTLAACLCERTVHAGPAHYDKDSKSFVFQYTFAVLPGGGGDPQLGQVQKPTPDQESVVKSLVGQVSDVLSSITGGRAKIGRLDYVDNIKDADLVVSLTGAPASPGYANLRAIEGQPGQLVLYYESLLPMIKQDVVFTATHELCHYIFGLTDEYNFPRGCPVRSGQGCLMDNYYATSRGFMGRFCSSADHDAEPAQQASCQEIVDKFFTTLGVDAGAPGANVGGAASASTDPKTTVVASAIARVRAKHMDDLKKGKTTSSLASFARTTLKALIDQFNRDNSSPLIVPTTQLGRILDGVIKAGQIVPLLKPGNLEAKAFDLITQEAKRLGEEVKDVKSEPSRLSKIRSGLRSFVQQLVRTNRIDAKAFAPSAQAALIDQVARAAARDPSLQALDRLVGIADITTELDLAMADDIISALDQLDVPGTRARLDWLASLRTKATKSYSIPGRTFSRFGTRRTRIITPDPGPESEYVLTQSGVFPYAVLRDRSVVQFSRLVNRSGKIQLVSPVNRAGAGPQPLAARIDRPFNDIPAEDLDASTASGASLQDVIADTIDQVQRNRLENLAVLVPPAGLPIDLGVQVPVIRQQLPPDADVRLDLVLVGPAQLDTEVRNLVIETRGSVLTVTDVDEIGAIAQRLKNEQTSGNWVIIPQQATIPSKDSGTRGPEDLKKRLDALRNLSFPANQGKSAEKLPREQQPPTSPSEVATRLEAAASALDKILADDGKPIGPRLTEAARRRILDVSLDFRWLHDAIGEKVRPRREEKAPRNDTDAVDRFSLSEIVPDADAADATIDNKRLVRVLGAGRQHLGRLRSFVDQVGSPSTPFNSQALSDFASQVQGHGKRKAARVTPTPDDADEEVKEDAPALPRQQVSTLGPNLRYVETVLRAYEHVLEASLFVAQQSVPIYKRLDRNALEVVRSGVEDARRQQVLGVANGLPALRVGDRLRLARFYAEGNADFELVVGLSRELPREHRDLSGVGSRKKRFRMELYNDLGIRAADDAKISLDENTSTPSMLVFRASTPPLRPGWYTPALVFERPEDLAYLGEEETNFTFSVGSNRPNIQLISGLVEDPRSMSKGFVKRAEEYAAIEVQVSAPSSVLKAEIDGYYQMITEGTEPIDSRVVEFRDDGTDATGRSVGQPGFDATKCDRAADDGIYTAFIPLADVKGATEYRVFVQADTTSGQATYIGLDNPHGDDPDKDADGIKPSDKKEVVQQAKATQAAEGSVLKFQRATSIHFHAEP